MEKKTIGGFIAALRKANGLTQKQLAEKLNVSDKSVSRWERDECAPDLSLIPVIAEIFGVTSDELLRGQRANPDAQPTKYEEQKTEKQLQHLLRSTLVQFQIRSTISVGIAIVGLIAAMICNFGFLRAYIGFGIGSIFYLAAAVCQVIFTILAFSALTGEEFECDQIAAAKSKLFTLTVCSGTIIAMLFAFTLPLATEVWDAYIGLNGDTWFVSGIIYAVFCAVTCTFIGGFIKRKLARTEHIPQSNRQAAVNKLKMKWLTITTVICLLTIAVSQLIVPGILSPSDLAEGRSFDNWVDFKEFMECKPAVTIHKQVYYYKDEDGNIISNPLPNKEVIQNDEGTELAEFYWINETIYEINYGDPENDYLPVTVYTSSHIRSGMDILENIQIMILLLIIPEIIVCVLLYRNSKKRIL